MKKNRRTTVLTIAPCTVRRSRKRCISVGNPPKDQVAAGRNSSVGKVNRFTILYADLCISVNGWPDHVAVAAKSNISILASAEKWFPKTGQVPGSGELASTFISMTGTASAKRAE